MDGASTFHLTTRLYHTSQLQLLFRFYHFDAVQFVRATCLFSAVPSVGPAGLLHATRARCIVGPPGHSSGARVLFLRGCVTTASMFSLRLLEPLMLRHFVACLRRLLLRCVHYCCPALYEPDFPRLYHLLCLCTDVFPALASARGWGCRRVIVTPWIL